jgi:hypothetical protein
VHQSAQADDYTVMSTRHITTHPHFFHAALHLPGPSPFFGPFCVARTCAFAARVYNDNH